MTTVLFFVAWLLVTVAAPFALLGYLSDRYRNRRKDSDNGR